MRRIDLGITRTGNILALDIPYVKGKERFIKDIRGDDTAEITIPIEELPEEISNYRVSFAKKRRFIRAVDTTLSNPVTWAGYITKIRENDNKTITIFCSGMKNTTSVIPCIPKANRTRIDSDELKWELTGTPRSIMSQVLTEVLDSSDGFPNIQSIVIPSNDGGSSSKKTINLYEIPSVADFIEGFLDDYEGVEMRFVPQYVNGNEMTTEWVLEIGTLTTPHIQKDLTPFEVNLDEDEGNLTFESITDGTGANNSNWAFFQSGAFSETEKKWIDLKGERLTPSNPEDFMFFQKEKVSVALTEAELNAQLTARLNVSNVDVKTFNVSQFNEGHEYVQALGRRIHFTGSNRIAGLDETVRIVQLTWSLGSEKVEIVVQPENYRVYPKIPKKNSDLINNNVNKGISENSWATPNTGLPAWGGNNGDGGTGGGGTDPGTPTMPTFEDPEIFTQIEDVFEATVNIEIPYTQLLPSYSPIDGLTSFKSQQGIIYGLETHLQNFQFNGSNASTTLGRDLRIVGLDLTYASNPIISEMAVLPYSVYGSNRVTAFTGSSAQEVLWHAVFTVQNKLYVYFLSFANELDYVLGEIYSSNSANTFVYSIELGTDGKKAEGSEWVLEPLKFEQNNEVFFPFPEHLISMGYNRKKIGILSGIFLPKTGVTKLHILQGNFKGLVKRYNFGWVLDFNSSTPSLILGGGPPIINTSSAPNLSVGLSVAQNKNAAWIMNNTGEKKTLQIFNFTKDSDIFNWQQNTQSKAEYLPIPAGPNSVINNSIGTYGFGFVCGPWTMFKTPSDTGSSNSNKAELIRVKGTLKDIAKNSTSNIFDLYNNYGSANLPIDFKTFNEGNSGLEYVENEFSGFSMGLPLTIGDGEYYWRAVYTNNNMMTFRSNRLAEKYRN